MGYKHRLKKLEHQLGPAKGCCSTCMAGEGVVRELEVSCLIHGVERLKPVGDPQHCPACGKYRSIVFMQCDCTEEIGIELEPGVETIQDAEGV